MEKHNVKNLIFVLDGYPYGGSSSCVFVRNMIVAISDMGIHCTVITPQIMTPGTLKQRIIPYYHTDYSKNGSEIPVYAPLYLYYPANLGMTKFSMNHHLRAVMRTIRKEKIKADAIYGHFIFQCGLTAVRAGKKLGIPSFLGVGESDKLVPGNRRNHGVYELGVKKLNWQEILSQTSGIICVSESTKKLLFDNGFLSSDCEEKTVVYINGVNQEIFYPDDKASARRDLDLPENDFIVLFVGTFNENKGVMCVSEAIDQLDGAKVIFIGSGSLLPDCEGTLFCGSCDNKTVAQYMRASDCFVLPTRSEGCCNAILEALSCGLPVISSELPFNEGILDENNSIRIDPDDVSQIKDAILQFRDNDETRKKLVDGVLVSAKNFSVEKRAKDVIEFMDEVIEKCI